MTAPHVPAQNANTAPPAGADFALERYKYILQQIHALNENVYRFLAIFQTLATALVAAALTVFVSYKKWGIAPATAKSGILGLLILETLIACFAMLLIFIGILSWLDYRNEECELTDEYACIGFRKPPRTGSFFRWYETYIILFIAGSTIFMWTTAALFLMPSIV
ncbi:hypothetical protein [Actinomadura chokoriensis]|uniref:MARVEL domain-containing protein n=1 Tax=Actinomadura chokoriensis TaxID=454156 RepID=A0ABV4R767_9ACTN